MISDPKVIAKMDEEKNTNQDDQDLEAESEEEHVGDEPSAGSEQFWNQLHVRFLDCTKARNGRRKRRSLRRRKSSKQIPLALGSPRFSQTVYIPKARYSHTKTSSLSFKPCIVLQVILSDAQQRMESYIGRKAIQRENGYGRPADHLSKHPSCCRSTPSSPTMCSEVYSSRIEHDGDCRVY